MEEDACLERLGVRAGKTSEVAFGELDYAPVEGCGDVEVEADDDGSGYADVFRCRGREEAARVG